MAYVHLLGVLLLLYCCRHFFKASIPHQYIGMSSHKSLMIPQPLLTAWTSTDHGKDTMSHEQHKDIVRRTGRSARGLHQSMLLSEPVGPHDFVDFKEFQMSKTGAKGSPKASETYSRAEQSFGPKRSAAQKPIKVLLPSDPLGPPEPSQCSPLMPPGFSKPPSPSMLNQLSLQEENSSSNKDTSLPTRRFVLLVLAAYDFTGRQLKEMLDESRIIIKAVRWRQYTAGDKSLLGWMGRPEKGVSALPSNSRDAWSKWLKRGGRSWKARNITSGPRSKKDAIFTIGQCDKQRFPDALKALEDTVVTTTTITETSTERRTTITTFTKEFTKEVKEVTTKEVTTKEVTKKVTTRKRKTMMKVNSKKSKFHRVSKSVAASWNNDVDVDVHKLFGNEVALQPNMDPACGDDGSGLFVDGSSMMISVSPVKEKIGPWLRGCPQPLLANMSIARRNVSFDFLKDLDSTSCPYSIMRADWILPVSVSEQELRQEQDAFFAKIAKIRAVEFLRVKI